MRLVACNKASHALGILPGLMLADARARVPELQVYPHDSGADRRWLERIALLADRHTPMVALDPPAGLLLDVTGCTHLFGGERGMTSDVRKMLAHQRLHFRHAFANTPEAAQGLAHFAGRIEDEEQAIGSLPVAALRLDAETETALIRAGLKTVGDLASRPTAPLTARFGTSMTDGLARLLGRADSRIMPKRPFPPLVFSQFFAEPIGRIEDALASLGQLAEEAAKAMETRQEGARRFIARLFRSDGESRNFIVETGLPLRDPMRVLRLFRERIDSLTDPLDPGFGFDLIRLVATRIERLNPTQLQLEEKSLVDGTLSDLIDRLSVRFGRYRLQRLIPVNTHIPERAVIARPAIETASASWGKSDEGEPPIRPLQLFEPPQMIDVIAEVPEGPPFRFRWQGRLHEVRLQEGPERIAPEWWRNEKGTLTRDYYRIEDNEGRRFWIFRNGLYGSEEAHPRWYLHGLFA